MDDDELRVENERLKSQRDILIRNSEDLHEQLRDQRGAIAQLQAETNRLGRSLVTQVTQNQLKDDELRDLRAELIRLQDEEANRYPLIPLLPWWKRIWRQP